MPLCFAAQGEGAPGGIPPNNFINVLVSSPEKVKFEDSMNFIKHFFDYTPVTFKNGDLVNEKGTVEVGDMLPWGIGSK